MTHSLYNFESPNCQSASIWNSKAECRFASIWDSKADCRSASHFVIIFLVQSK